MGYIKHHSIIVTAYKDDVAKVHAKAVEIFGTLVSNIVKSKKNYYESFFIAPDGSKEGWDDSDRGDEAREDFINWADNQTGIDDDDSLSFEWVEVSYDEEGKTNVCRSGR